MLDARPLTPEARLRNPEEPPQGYEVPLMGGALWTLFPVGACCEDAEVSLLQDELYDAIAYEGKFRREALFRAFEAAIRINYDLTPSETALLFWSVDPDHREPAANGGHFQFSLIQAVLGAILPSESQADVTYSDWLHSTLLINGIKPEDIPPERLPAVLGHLIMLGKAVAPDEIVSSAVRGAERRRGRELAARPE